MFCLKCRKVAPCKHIEPSKIHFADPWKVQVEDNDGEYNA